MSQAQGREAKGVQSSLRDGHSEFSPAPVGPPAKGGLGPLEKLLFQYRGEGLLSGSVSGCLFS